MKIECPKCGLALNNTEEELSKLNHITTCPRCLSTLKIVDGIAYIPSSKVPIEKLQPLEEQPPEFKGQQYYETGNVNPNLDPLYNAAVQYLRTCNAITLPMLQRYLDVPPERAELIMQQLEDNKVVAPYDGMHPRKILIDHNQGLPGIPSHLERYDSESTNNNAPSMTNQDSSKPSKPTRMNKWVKALPVLYAIMFALLIIYYIIAYVKH